MEPRPHERRGDDFSAREYPVPERIEDQRRAWKWERIALLGLLGIVLLALAGAFSRGPLSDASLASATGRLQVEYERFERLGASSRLHVTLRGAPHDEARLRLTGDLLESHDVQSLQPLMPARSWHGGLELQGRLDELGELHLYLALLSTRPGLLSHQLEYSSETLEFHQLVYP